MTLEYEFDNGACVPKRIHTIVISTQHDESIALEDLRQQLKEKVIKPVIPAHLVDSNTIYHLNPSGMFVIGGPMVSYYLVT